jgi:transcriptional regulator with XRE-family HTH domain
MPKKSKAIVVDAATSDTMKRSGKRLAAIRGLAGLTQEQVAALLGVDQSQWSRWERGIRPADPLVMVKFVSRARATLDLIYRGVTIGSHPDLVKLLEASVPDLLVREPSDTDQGTDTALASYRNSILLETTE